MADPAYKSRIQNFKNKGKDQDVSVLYYKIHIFNGIINSYMSSVSIKYFMIFCESYVEIFCTCQQFYLIFFK